MKNLFYVLVCFITVVSCSGYKDNLFYNSLQESQIDFNNNSGEANLLPNDRLVHLHKYRRNKLLELNYNLKVKNGYVFILDQLGDSYSPYSYYGNIWSKKGNVYYKYVALNNSFEIVADSYADEEWNLFKRATEEWDLNQINKYYQVKTPEGFAKYIASRVEFKNNKIINIQTYAWHD